MAQLQIRRHVSVFIFFLFFFLFLSGSAAVVSFFGGCKLSALQKVLGMTPLFAKMRVLLRDLRSRVGCIHIA